MGWAGSTLIIIVTAAILALVYVHVLLVPPVIIVLCYLYVGLYQQQIDHMLYIALGGIC